MLVVVVVEAQQVSWALLVVLGVLLHLLSVEETSPEDPSWTCLDDHCTEDVWEDQGSQMEVLHRDGVGLEDLVVQDILLADQGVLVGKTSGNSSL